DPCATPAIPPISTKSTPWRFSASKIRPGSKLAGGRTAVPPNDLGQGDPLPDTFVGGELEVSADQRHVVAPVDRVSLEHELLVHQPQQLREGVHPRRDEPALDPRDRRLRGSGADRELLLRQPVAPADGAEQLGRGHLYILSDMRPRW